MIAPLYANTCEITTFKEGKEDYILLRFFWRNKPMINSIFPAIEFIPVSTVLITRTSWKNIQKTLAGFLARQEEPLPPEDGGKL